jgi:hypothetical protein
MRAVYQEQACHEPVASKKKAAFRNAAFSDSRFLVLHPFARTVRPQDDEVVS